MSNDDPKPAPGQPHAVKAGVFDAFFDNKGPNGELMYRGRPLIVSDVADTEDDDEDQAPRQLRKPG